MRGAEGTATGATGEPLNNDDDERPTADVAVDDGTDGGDDAPVSGPGAT